MESTGEALPRIARGAFWLCVAMAFLTLVSSFFNPVPGLFQLAWWTAFALGIRSRRPWAAIAAAIFVLTPAILVIVRGSAPASILVLIGLFYVSIALVMFMATAALWHDTEVQGRGAPWIAAVTVFAVGSLCLEPFSIPSASMKPTLLVGDFVVVNRVKWLLGGSPHRGEMVVFRYPLDPTQVYVKRVAGAPGDRVHIQEGKLYVNGAATVEPYVIHERPQPDPYRDNFPVGQATFQLRPRAQEMLQKYVHDGELVIPEGSYFVLGDNRDDADDSRYWGLLPRANIVGAPLMIYGSYDMPTEALSGPQPTPPTILNMRWNRLFKTF